MLNEDYYLKPYDWHPCFFFQDEVLLLMKTTTVTTALFIPLRFSIASGPGRLSAAGINFVTALQEAGEFMINFPKACKRYI